MNNEGWGLTSMLMFLAILFFGLAISVIIYNKNIKPKEINEEQSVIEEESKTENEEEINDETIKVVDYNTSNYKKLEQQLATSTLNYFNDKNIKINNYKIVVGMEQLKNEGYIEDIIDPENNSKCSGYSVYDGVNVIPFIKCIGTYQTDNYNKNFE